MKNEYLCPYCRGHLKVGNNIIFAVRTKSQARGLLLLSPELGNYRCNNHESLELVEGERVETFCPMCHSNLRAINVNKNLAEVIMVDEEGEQYEIYFSEIVGEHSTYKITDSDIESYGDDSDDYMNYFGS
jgi:uncharacterized protein YbaR (Trm112 family)